MRRAVAAFVSPLESSPQAVLRRAVAGLLFVYAGALLLERTVAGKGISPVAVLMMAVCVAIWQEWGGRSDIASGRVDVRVLALLRYLAEAHGQVTVSCLISGHGLYARPGVVSAHIYGEAVDISALGDVSIYGNQQPGGLTEKAVRNVLLLPVELRPKQVISLLGLGGPSFALADHYDHIHVGY